MTTPIESMLASVEWSVEPPQDPGDLPHVTHSGVLNLFGTAMRCYRLSDGRAIFNAEDFQSFFSDFLEPTP